MLQTVYLHSNSIFLDTNETNHPTSQRHSKLMCHMVKLSTLPRTSVSKSAWHQHSSGAVAPILMLLAFYSDLLLQIKLAKDQTSLARFSQKLKVYSLPVSRSSTIVSMCFIPCFLSVMVEIYFMKYLELRIKYHSSPWRKGKNNRYGCCNSRDQGRLPQTNKNLNRIPQWKFSLVH